MTKSATAQRPQLTPSNIPDDLKRCPQWLVWRYEQRDGKSTKVPYSTRNDRAKVNDPATWTDFESALDFCLSRGFDGVGFVLTAEDNFFAVDLDHVINRETGEAEAWALDLVSQLDTYTEITPSGTGLRFFGRGQLPPGGRNKRLPNGQGIEVYDSGKYLTVTGAHYAGTSTAVEERGEQIAAAHRKYFAPRKEPRAAAAPPPEPLNLDDAALIEKAQRAKNGADFCALWNGDTSRHNDDHSRADAALCAYLAFWTQHDTARMDTLFRQSGLCRPKWDEPHAADGSTYGQMTIARAVQNCSKVYEPPKKGHPTGAQHRPAPDDATNEDAGRPEPGDFALDEIGNGQRFAAQHSDSLRFCKPWEEWVVHDDGRWQTDAHGEAERRAKATARQMAADAAREDDDDKRARRLKHALTLTKRANRETMLKDAASEPGMMVTPEQFDCDLQALNTANGILNLETGDFGAHDPARLLTLQSPVLYDSQAACSTWLRCLARWIPDQATRDFIQEAFGVTLSGKVYEEFFVFLFGDGDNGKSTFLRILERLLGTYWHKTQAETLMKARDTRDANAPAPELLALKGARLVTAHEMDSKHEFNAALIKDLTGRDAITARGMYEKRLVTFEPQFTLWMFGNSKPQIKDTSGGMWRRVRLIDFGPPIPADERDPQLGEKLDAELPGILNWALEGLQRVHERGLVVPEAVKAATSEYRNEQDPVAQFIEARCVTGKQHTTTAGELWGAWCAWCRANGEREGTQKGLGAELRRRGYTPFSNHPRRWQGFTIATPEHTEATQEPAE